MSSGWEKQVKVKKKLKHDDKEKENADTHTLSDIKQGGIKAFQGILVGGSSSSFIVI